jgi:phosphatidylinositol glycan class N
MQSHFVIASAFIVFQIILFAISHLLVGNVFVPMKKNRKKIL